MTITDTTTHSPTAYPLGSHGDLVPNLALTADMADTWSRRTIEAMRGWTITFLEAALAAQAERMHRAAVEAAAVLAGRAATVAAAEATTAAVTEFRRWLDALGPALRKLDDINLEALTPPPPVNTDEIIARAVAEARAVALESVTVSIPEVVRVAQAGTTEVVLKRDDLGRVERMIQRPATGRN